MYVGDIGYKLFDPANTPVDTCVIACVDPDGRTLIVGETMGHRLTAFDVQPDGSLVNRRVYAQLPEEVHPDGIALDAESAVWLANPEGHAAGDRGPGAGGGFSLRYPDA